MIGFGMISPLKTSEPGFRDAEMSQMNG